MRAVQDSTTQIVLRTMEACAKVCDEDGRSERAAGYRQAAKLLQRALEQDQRAESEYHQQVQELRDLLEQGEV